MSSQVLYIFQIVVGILLTILILLQAKGTGLGSTFGGDFGFYGTKRGAERLLFTLTIIISFIFLCLSATTLFLKI